MAKTAPPPPTTARAHGRCCLRPNQPMAVPGCPHSRPSPPMTRHVPLTAAPAHGRSRPWPLLSHPSPSQPAAVIVAGSACGRPWQSPPMTGPVHPMAARSHGRCCPWQRLPPAPPVADSARGHPLLPPPTTVPAHGWAYPAHGAAVHRQASSRPALVVPAHC